MKISHQLIMFSYFYLKSNANFRGAVVLVEVGIENNRKSQVTASTPSAPGQIFNVVTLGKAFLWSPIV